MNRFAATLRQLDDQLPLPQHARARVLLEVAADLDDAFEIGLHRGLSEADAEGAALAAFRPSSEAVAQLVCIHGGLLARLLDGVSEQARSRWDRSLVATVAFVTLALTGHLVWDLELFTAAGGWAWGLVCLCAVALVVGVAKVYRLFIAKDHRPRTVRRGLGLMVSLAAVQIMVGLGLATVGSYSWLTALISTWPADPAAPLAKLLHSSALATVALFGGIVTALGWFLLSQRVARIEVEEAQLLLQLERSS